MLCVPRWLTSNAAKIGFAAPSAGPQVNAELQRRFPVRRRKLETASVAALKHILRGVRVEGSSRLAFPDRPYLPAISGLVALEHPLHRWAVEMCQYLA